MSDSGFASLTCNLGGAEKDFSEEKNVMCDVKNLS